MSRASKYETKVKPKLDVIEGWARNGLTLEDIASNLGVSRKTFQTYKNKYAELREAIDQGREVADIRVENALYRRAVGFYSNEERLVRVPDPDGGGHYETIDVRVYHKPDVRAIIFWLKNRKPEVWREKIIELEDFDELKDMLRIAGRSDEEDRIPDDVGTAAQARTVSVKN